MNLLPGRVSGQAGDGVDVALAGGGRARSAVGGPGDPAVTVGVRPEHLHEGTGDGRSDDMETHTSTRPLLHHRADADAQGRFARPDEVIHMDDEPGHQALCDREQAHFLDAILHDRDLTASVDAAVESLRIVLAADESIRTGRPVRLHPGPRA